MPASARSNPPGRSTTASTLPVDGWIATRSIGFLVRAADTAAEAAIWACMSRLVCTGRPGTAANRAAVAVDPLARALDPDGQRRAAGQPGLVGLLDAALADHVARLVGRTERLGLGRGGRHHVAGEQRDRAGLGDHAGGAQVAAVGGQYRGPGRPHGVQREPLARPQPGVDGGRAPVHPPALAALDQRQAALVGPGVPAGQAGRGGVPGGRRAAAAADLAQVQPDTAHGRGRSRPAAAGWPARTAGTFTLILSMAG